MKLHSVLCYIALAIVSQVLMSCGQKSNTTEQEEESREAKQLLQGVWMDEETEAVVFQMKGDSVLYSDSTSMPAYFKVIKDTLYIGNSARYHIQKQTAHLLWFKNQNGEIVKFVKADGIGTEEAIPQQGPQILTLTEVLKRDTVVYYDSQRYHCYVAINPTKYKVVKQTVNEEGLGVENVYYDNIIHISIYKGATQMFSRDFKKQFYELLVSKGYLGQAILNDMQYSKTNHEGFHFNVSLCKPDESSCYLIEQTISFSGKVSIKLLEF